MTKEKMVLKIKIEPKEIPCHDCVKGCMGDEFVKCKKLKAHNKKIAAKEYDYDKAIEVMAKEVYKKRWIESECKNKNTLGFFICKDYAEIALNALLEGEKDEK